MLDPRATRSRLLAALLILGLCAATTTSVAAQERPSADEVELSAALEAPAGELGLSGEEAVEALESVDATEDVAEAAGLSSEELVEELTHDPSMFLRSDGRVGYAEELPEGADTVTRSTTGTVTAPVPQSESATLAPPPGTDVFALDSLPGSTKVLYLDFDGHQTTSDGWAQVGGPAEINSAPYVPIRSAEEEIYTIWQMVSEDFLPFGVNVTTQDPGVDGIIRSNQGDTSYGQRVVISPTNWRNDDRVLGIALLNSFGGPTDDPAFVFINYLWTEDVAEAVSHEAGHTFGLGHDGRVVGGATEAYYSGHDGWAPIMGDPIDKLVTQWSKGEYANANNRQDDLAIIRQRAGLRPDDHSNAKTGATVVAPNAAQPTSGFIGVGGDKDVFVTTVGATAMTVSVRPTETWTNLHARVLVRDSKGAIINAARPEEIWGWTASVQLPAIADTYTIEVTGSPWLTANNGFTSYGSLGGYELHVGSTASVGFEPLRPDRLVDTRVGVGGSTRIGAGRTIVVDARARGVAADATAVVVNIVSVNPSAAGYVTAYPCTEFRPTTSSLNYGARQTVGNTVIAALSPTGLLCLYAHTQTDLVVDVAGWLGPSGAQRFTSVGPDRVMDTRTGLGGTRRLRGGQTAELTIPNLPAGTTAVSLNVTGVNASTAGFIRLNPCGKPAATASLNHDANEVRPNNAIVGVTSGKVCIYSLAATDIVVDITGYFGPSGRRYLPVPPVRLLDTRVSPGIVGPGGAVQYRAAAAELVATAASVNVAAVAHPVNGFVTTFDCVTRRTTATLNPIVGEVNSNGAIVPLRSGRDSCLYSLGGGHLIVDLNGWWVP